MGKSFLNGIFERRVSEKTAVNYIKSEEYPNEKTNFINFLYIDSNDIHR